MRKLVCVGDVGHCFGTATESHLQRRRGCRWRAPSGCTTWAIVPAPCCVLEGGREAWYFCRTKLRLNVRRIAKVDYGHFVRGSAKGFRRESCLSHVFATLEVAKYLFVVDFDFVHAAASEDLSCIREVDVRCVNGTLG